ncbi:MAG: hypothetical protein M1269_10390 [Chloroflexi bacterium]|nr:hypothetical protein [Chloroflexota bacterium]
MKKYLLMLAAGVLFLVLLSETSFATGILVPEWNELRSLTLESLSVKTDIKDNIAETKCIYNFQNDTQSRIEALFLFTLPKNATVTGFAYYFKGEKIKAMIVENGRAEKIYQTVKRMGRDPALMKRKYGNTYQVAIFPVETGNVKIELTYVETLTSENGSHIYSFPLAGENSANLINKFNFEASIESPYTIKSIKTSYPAATSITSAHLAKTSFSADELAPDKPFQLEIESAPADLKIFLSAAKSGGDAGFFALSLTPDKSLENPVISISGIETFSTFPWSFPSIKAGQTLTLLGRYYPGKAAITLSGQSPSGYKQYKTIKTFPDVYIPNNPAMKLWAEKYLKYLGDSARTTKDKKKAQTTIRLSKRYGVLSPFTTFLAIPKSELEAYLRRFRDEIESFKNLVDKFEGAYDKRVAVEKPWFTLEQIPKGDPLIEVNAPADSLSVVAIFPGGEIRRLTYDDMKKRWIIRFDLPVSTESGLYTIKVLITYNDGRKKELSFRYYTGTPELSGKILNRLSGSPGDLVDISVKASPVTRRVMLALPWANEELYLASRDGLFRGTFKIPTKTAPGTIGASLILIDGGHNRKIIKTEVEVSK